MIEKLVSYVRRPRAFVWMMLAGVSVSIGACRANEGGIEDDAAAGASGDDSDATADAASEAAEITEASPEAAADTADPLIEAASMVPDESDAATRASCVFHTPPSVAMDASAADPVDASVALPEAGPDSDGSAAAAVDASMSISDAGSASDGGRARGDGATADAGPPVDVSIEMSGFSYLADTAGRALYVYASDVPGDCEQLPVSNCEADCLISWPIFDAKKRRLPSTLSDELFGTIRRADGTEQTTYRGWPLYYFKTDTARGMVTGQGKSKVWFLATVLPPGITIMKTGTEKRLADGTGRTVYAYGKDIKGGEVSDPESTCTGDCARAYPPVLQNRISVVSSLEPSDFSLFLRRGTTRLHLAYKGSPLYYAAADEHRGELKGVTPEWSIVAP